MSNASGLESFRNFLDQYRRLVTVAIGASAVPFAAALSSLTPAWPSGVAGVTAVVQLLVLALVFQLLRSADRRVVNRVMLCSTFILVVLLPIYFVLLAQFIYTDPSSKERFTKGFACTTNAKIVYGELCPFLGEDEMKKAGFAEERMWTPASLSITKAGVLTLWLACFVSLSTALGSFVVYQLEHKKASGAPT